MIVTYKDKAGNTVKTASMTKQYCEDYAAKMEEMGKEDVTIIND